MGMMKDSEKKPDNKPADLLPKDQQAQPPLTEKKAERGGPKGPEPTRYGDWESGGRCTDF